MKYRNILLGVLMSVFLLFSSVLAERINANVISNQIKNIRIDLGFDAELSYDASLNGVVPLYYQLDYILNQSFSFNVYHAYLALMDVNYEVYRDNFDNNITMNGFSEIRAGVEYHLLDDEVTRNVAIRIKSEPYYGSWVKISFLDKQWLVRKMLNARIGFYRYTRTSSATTVYDSSGLGDNLNNTYGATINSNGLYIGLAWIEQAHIAIESNKYGVRSRDYFNKLGVDVMFTDTELDDDNLEPFTSDEGVEVFFTSNIGWRLFWEAEQLSPISMRLELGQRPGFKNDFYFLAGLGWAFTLQL